MHKINQLILNQKWCKEPAPKCWFDYLLSRFIGCFYQIEERGSLISMLDIIWLVVAHSCFCCPLLWLLHNIFSDFIFLDIFNFPELAFNFCCLLFKF